MKIEQISIEKMCYKKNKLSYSLIILGLLANVFYFFTIYRNNNNYYYNYQMGLSVIYNLLFMLMVFLSAEEIKNYHRNFAFVLLGISILQICRIFYYPKNAYENGVLSKNGYTAIIIYLSISAAFLISGAIISIIKCTLLKKFKQQNRKNEGE